MEELSLDNNIILYNMLDIAILQLDILFSTEKTELITDVMYGTDFYSFLWQCTPSKNELKNYIYEIINTKTNIYENFDVSISVDAITPENAESAYMIYIDVKSKNNESIRRHKTYKLG